MSNSRRKWWWTGRNQLAKLSHTRDPRTLWLQGLLVQNLGQSNANYEEYHHINRPEPARVLTWQMVGLSNKKKSENVGNNPMAPISVTVFTGFLGAGQSRVC
jgi:hypothetical protein